MDIDSAKRQAKALVRALHALGLAHLDAPRALEVVAQMHGFRNWHAARGAGAIGRWNAAQAAVHTSWRGTLVVPPRPGETYAGCETLFVAVMDVAGAQPLSRAIRTVEHWAERIGELAARQAAGEDVASASRPVRLPAPLAQALREQWAVDPAERVQRLQETRDILYEAALSLRRAQPVRVSTVLLLDSRDGSDYALALGVPPVHDLRAAQRIAQDVLAQLQARSPDYSAAELLVRLAQRGLAPLALEYGPVWDSMD